MNKEYTRQERKKRADRIKDLKAVFLYNEKKQVFTKEEMESIQKEFFELFNIKHALRTFPKYTVSNELNDKIEKVLNTINS